MAANASQQGNQPAPIIIKKVKKYAAGHHGGAWKVAYADFVTAMMAFFLLLWLLNVTTSEQRKGIADYFSPASVSKSTSGSGGVLGGTTITTTGVMTSDKQPLTVTASVPSKPSSEDSNQDIQKGAKNPKGPADESGGDSQPISGKPDAKTPPTDQAGGQSPSGTQDQAGRIGDKALEEALARREKEQFEKARRDLMEAIQSVPELAQLANNIVIDETPEGLRIQIVDQANYSMFPLGSSQMFPQTRDLMALVAKVVGKLPNKLSISGHTDSMKFANASSGYGNWELSTDRANASRRALVNAGVDEARIATVVGRADRDPFVPDDPGNPRNRRISLVLLTGVHHGTANPGDSNATPGPAAPAAPALRSTPPAPVIPVMPPPPAIPAAPPAAAIPVAPPAPAIPVTPSIPAAPPPLTPPAAAPALVPPTARAVPVRLATPREIPVATQN